MSLSTSNTNLAGSIPRSAVRVLVVDDNDPLRRLFVRSLEEAGFEVHSAQNGVRAAELLRLVRERDLEVPVVLVTGSPSPETAADAAQYGACQYLAKPVDLSHLRQVVQRAAGL
jgi:DNA-binding NtrC family response regulator